MSQIQEIKEANDIVEIIGSRVTLQRAGTYMKGLCPFHSEKSPSFFVDENLQRFKCFGCGESGDVITFLEKYDGMTFAEALEDLANRAGITIKKYTKTLDDVYRENILTVLGLAKQYYHYLLTNHKVGDQARKYLQKRGVTKESIKLFQIGYSLSSWDGLINFLHKKKKYSLKLLLDAGLVIEGKNGRYYDRFRDRIIFPLTDHRGRVVGFSGRIIKGDEKDAKYINSPETVLYHKSKMLFGFSELYQQIRKSKQVVVVEGEFDVISSVQANMNSVVAIKGSALTADHAKLLKRTVDRVLLSLDTDDAGVKATKKAITALKNTELELRVVIIPNGKDPDDLIKANPKKWREVVKASIPAHEFLIKASLKQYDKTKPEGKKAIMKELSPLFAEIEHAVELEYYMKFLAKELDTKMESIKADIELYKTKKNRQKLPIKTRQNNKKVIKKISQRESLEKNLLFLLFQFNESKIIKNATLLKDLRLEIYGGNYLISSLLKLETSFSLKSFSIKLPTDIQEKLFDIYSDQQLSKKFNVNNLDNEFKAVLKKLNLLIIRKKIDVIASELGALDRKENKTEEELQKENELLKKNNELLKKIVQLESKIKK